MGGWLLSQRDRLIAAGHEVPGYRCTEVPVPEGRSKSLSVSQIFVVEPEPRHEQATARRMLMPLQNGRYSCRKVRVQPSLWDGAIFLMIAGTSCLPTIGLSLRDKNHSRVRAFRIFRDDVLNSV
jgi:hypothetical protein